MTDRAGTKHHVPFWHRLVGSAAVHLFAAAGIARVMPRIWRETVQIRRMRGPR
jgi:hypothetical protein